MKLMCFFQIKNECLLSSDTRAVIYIFKAHLKNYKSLGLAKFQKHFQKIR